MMPWCSLVTEDCIGDLKVMLSILSLEQKPITVAITFSSSY